MISSKGHNKWLVAALAVVSGVVLAGASFTPNEQPFGYVSGPALSGDDLSTGTVKAYVPWFDFGNYHGDLQAVPVTAAGGINLLTPVWRAAEVLNDANDADGNYWDDYRFIVTMHADGYPVPFRKDTLADSQVDALKGDEDKRIKFLRGDRDEEGGKFRTRTSILGDIIHSNPTYVGAPRGGHVSNGYLGFAATHASRTGRIYVGANDGMLHAFNAATGVEAFAYIPATVIPNLQAYAEEGYSHQYFVDGTITVEDAYFNSAWHSVLVSGLGAGGRGLFALDVTSESDIVNEGNLASGAGSRVLWEFNNTSFGGSNLGYTYSRPSIVKMQNGVWAAVIGNGYVNSSGIASLFVLDISDGSVIKEIAVSDADENGMSSPTLADTNSDGMVDLAYAGDLNGNLWKFDIASNNPASWAVAHGGKALLQTTQHSGVRNAITAAPDVGTHPYGGFFVYAATGRLFNPGDVVDKGEQAVYGIWDHDWPAASLPFDDTVLIDQTLTEMTHPVTNDPVRTASNHQPDWNTHKGWRTSLEVSGAASYQKGERVIQNFTLRSGRVQVVSSNPTTEVGTNWLLQLDANTGGAPGETVLDINKDGNFGLLDNADGNGDGEVTDAAEDRVVGEFQQFGLASAPTFAGLSEDGEAAVINHLSLVNQVHTDPPPGEPPGDGGEDFGIIGGHFDVDVSSQTYAIGDGETDNHKHEWDDSYGPIVDYFDVLGGFRSIDDFDGAPGSSSAQVFFITIANAHLSPAAILEINGVSFPVKEWRALIKRYLNGNLGSGETFPRFKLGPTTDSDTAQGIIQLTSLRIAFPSNAIQLNGIHGTNTGCVKGNDPSPGGEYRNGALTLQILDATNISGGYQYDAPSEVYYVPDSGTNKIHRMGYAVPVNGVHEVGDGMMYEGTIFWHWGGSCYDVDNVVEYAADYVEEVGVEDTRGTDDDIYGGTPDDDSDDDPADEGGDDGDDPSIPDDREEDASEQDVTATKVGAADRLGRLFWRELIPDA